jgi:formylglycine-generating enzyme required for sulfatase activity
MAKNWAILIGINQYDNLHPLKYAKRDAEAMRDWCEKEGRFDRGGIFLFTDDSPAIPTNPPIVTQPTYGRLKRFLQTQFEEPLLQSGDNIWFFFAGHGRRDRDKDYLMLPDSDPQNVGETAISVDYVTERLRRSGADNVVLFLDACRDEGGSRSGVGIGNEEHRGIITFYSCTANQRSWEVDELQHGSFTYALLEGLRRQGESNCATVERLNQYLLYQVPEINVRYKKERQNPYLKAEPPYKLYFILIERAANLKDAEPLKLQASLAENRGNLELAEQLWIRVLGLSRVDLEAIEAIKRIARKQHQFPKSINEATEQVSQKEVLETSRGSKNEPEKILGQSYQTFNFEMIKVNARGEEIKRESKQAQYFTQDLGNGISLDMIIIPEGRFLMGTEDSEIQRLCKKYNTDYFRHEKPQHHVDVKSFHMGKYPITQAQWKAIASRQDLKMEIDLNPDPARFKGSDLPVEKVRWEEAIEFCGRITKLAGREYRLPSEAEWEYACRAGTSTPFYLGETITGELANYNGNYTYADEAKGQYRERTTPVGQFPPNTFGLYDMHGNVWEWCLDPWHENYEGAPKDGKVWDEENKSDNRYQNILDSINKLVNDQRTHVLRGGSWDNFPRACRSACRSGIGVGSDVVGFRVVCPPS